jgi:hypothetical protein
MTDAELVTAFEQLTIPPGTFHHREHLRLTWVYLRMYGRAETERRLLSGLAAFARAAGKPGKFSAALTHAWIAAVDAARAASPGATTFDGLIAAHPQLLDPRTVATVQG